MESFPAFFLSWVSRCLLSVYFKPVKMCCLISSPYPAYPNENPEVQELFFLHSWFPGLGNAEKSGSTFLVSVELDTPLCSWFLITAFRQGSWNGIYDETHNFFQSLNENLNCWTGDDWAADPGGVCWGCSPSVLFSSSYKSLAAALYCLCLQSRCHIHLRDITSYWKGKKSH